jgi:hypothetical protein
MGKSIDPMLKEKAGRSNRAHSRRSSASMSLQPVIPWRVALQQCPPLLHRPASECDKVALPVNRYRDNGDTADSVNFNRPSEPPAAKQKTETSTQEIRKTVRTTGTTSVLNICLILLGEQVFVHPMPPTFRKNDGASPVLVQPLLENPAAQIVGLAQHHLPDGQTKLVIRNERLLRRLCKPRRLENPRRSSGPLDHIPSVAPGAIEFPVNSLPFDQPFSARPTL